MRTGVVLSNVLAHRASTELALTFVRIVSSCRILTIGEYYCIRWYLFYLTEQIGRRHIMDCHFQEVHKPLVLICQPDNQSIIHTAVMFHTELFQVNLLSARR